MTNRLCTVLGLALMVVVSCGRGPGKPPGLEGAGPLVAEFVRAAKGLDDIGPAVAAWSGEGELPGDLVADMTSVGEAARAVLRAAEPDGAAGATALSQAVIDAGNEVVRHLVSVAGGREEEPGRMALNSPGPVVFDTAAKLSPDDLRRSRTELGKIEAKERLEGDLRVEIERFVYVALLAHPESRAALAPRLSPDDLPATVPNDLNLPVATRDEWRSTLFDDQNRLVVPSDPVPYRAFIGWIKVVNPDLGFAAARVADKALRYVTGR